MAENNMLMVLNFFYKQCEEAMKLGGKLSIDPPINAVIIGGVGGSAIPGDILSCYLEQTTPLFINRRYSLPEWANKNTVVFLISYSGNTEETIFMYRHARKKQCKLIVITSGGTLRDMAVRDGISLITVPKGINPRDATGYLTIPIINVLENSGIIRPTKDAVNMIRVLHHDHQEKAKDLAKKLVDRIPIIYASGSMFCVARAWKIKMNENAKIPAFWNEFPELNHNEMVGFTNLTEKYFAVFISDKDDHPRIQKRMDITKRLLNEHGVQTLELRLTGENKLARIFSAILLGSYVSYYLALHKGVDPDPVNMVEQLKKELGNEGLRM